jgi:hypothetical protein
MNPRPPKREDLLGIWRLVSVETPTRAGGIEHPFGRAPTGTIVYLANGSMAVHIDGSDEAAGRLRAYAGSWRIEGDRVVHEVEASVEPELRGVRLERRAELEGDRLVYRTVEAQGSGHPVVIWRRA